jgi:hypothetical protein
MFKPSEFPDQAQSLVTRLAGLLNRLVTSATGGAMCPDHHRAPGVNAPVQP